MTQASWLTAHQAEARFLLLRRYLRSRMKARVD